jgi:hypothetical protein
MSERQMQRYHTVYPFLEERDNIVLSSVFDDKTLAKLKLLRENIDKKDRSGWVVLGSPSWIKGADDAKEYCEKNGLTYEVLWDKSYEETLATLSLAKGLVYLPRGGDTCPRLVIEAKLLGCKLIINDNVLHYDEEWFKGELQ